MVEITRLPDEHPWEPHVVYGRVRIVETSCCGEYEWACEGGLYVVLRDNGRGGHEETGRGRYPDARQVWDELVVEHRAGHETAWPKPGNAETPHPR